jgi:hypothetical protein
MKRLYHGSSEYFDEVDLSKTQHHKDFGQGFYLTELPKQAESWAKAVSLRNHTKKAYVHIFDFDDTDLTHLNYLHFPKPSQEWVYFVLNNRNLDFRKFAEQPNNLQGQYDIVEGPVADDRIATVLNMYLLDVVSPTAIVEALTYKNLSHQISLHTDQALKLLTKVGSDVLG